MKNLFVLFHTLLLPVFGISQTITPEALDRLPPLKKEEAKEYLQEAKDYRNAGLVLLPVGAALATGGFVINNNIDVYDEEEASSGQLKALGMVGLGALCMIASVPAFIKSINRRHKAKAIIYANKGVSMSPHILIPNTSSVGIKVIFPLGR